MRQSLIILSAAVLLGACNSKPEVTTIKSDTKVVTEKKKPEPFVPTQDKKTTTSQTSSSNSTATDSEAMSSETDNAAKKNSGWSKTAKGAVIGGVVGAGTGAIVNKKNRAKGAIIGGVAGAGTGAIIGNEMDKKDGRH